MQSEAFQKCIENSLRVDAKNGKTLVIANGHVKITFFVIFVAFTLMAPNAKDNYNFNDLPRPHITAFGLRVRLVCVILRFIAPKTEDDAQCY